MGCWVGGCEGGFVVLVLVNGGEGGYVDVFFLVSSGL